MRVEGILKGEPYSVFALIIRYTVKNRVYTWDNTSSPSEMRFKSTKQRDISKESNQPQV